MIPEPLVVGYTLQTRALRHHGATPSSVQPVEGVLAQGNRILSAEEFEEVIVVPAGEEAFALDSSFFGGFAA